MYAIIATGGKQYKVTEGTKLSVEKLPGEKGATVEIDQVLLVGGEGSLKIGTPMVGGAKITATIIRQGKDAKVLIFKKKKRKGYRKMQGHRQQFTELHITKIAG
ncbi:MAG: 50S ribosomal protein L21 [Deltaproteobacteria bacterium]|nr:50S ribosomal protein L21 [Deltaproteobacteria bacterium]